MKPESLRDHGNPKQSKKAALGSEHLAKTGKGEQSRTGTGSASEYNEEERVRQYFAQVVQDKSRSAASGADAAAYAEVLAHAVNTFGSRTNANAWLNKPNRLFHNRTPLQILTEDPAAVEEELVRIDHGMIV